MFWKGRGSDSTVMVDASVGTEEPRTYDVATNTDNVVFEYQMNSEQEPPSEYAEEFELNNYYSPPQWVEYAPQQGYEEWGYFYSYGAMAPEYPEWWGTYEYIPTPAYPPQWTYVQPS